MIYLLISAGLNVVLFMSFRSYATFKINTLHAVIVNYFVCVITGLFFIDVHQIGTIEYQTPWLIPGILLGISFIITFYVAAVAAQVSGMGITSVAGKMSMVLTVVFNLIFINVQTKQYSVLNYGGMILALVAVLMSSWPQRQNNSLATSDSKKAFLLPIAVFVLSGMVDIIINFSNYKYVPVADKGMYSLYSFVIASLAGVIVLAFRREIPNVRSIIGGIYLGIPNYFALYTVLEALEDFNNDGAYFYPIYNVVVIGAATLTGAIVFKEKLKLINLAGLALALAAIFLVSYQEILAFFNG